MEQSLTTNNLRLCGQGQKTNKIFQSFEEKAKYMEMRGNKIDKDRNIKI